MSSFSPSSENRTRVWDNPHFIRLIESHQVSSDCILTVRLHFYLHKHGIQWTDQSSRWGTSTGGQLPQTWENNPENTHSAVTGNPTHKQLHNKLYHQTIGASRGTIPSPEICDICLYKILKQLSRNSPHKNKIKIHARFLDDGYMIWEKAPAHDVADFFQTANNFHNLLRFTPTTSSWEITFLDTTISYLAS